MEKVIELGSILIAKPFIEDKRFEKTIILIIEHNTNGSVGLVLNKKASIKIDELIEDFSAFNIPLNNGGPVDIDNLFFIHKYPDIINESKEIKDGLFLGGSLQDVIKGLNSGEISNHLISFFIGYAGWEKGQLEEELKEGSWILHKNAINKLNHNLKWSELLIDINKEYEVWASAPSDFHLN